MTPEQFAAAIAGHRTAPGAAPDLGASGPDGAVAAPGPADFGADAPGALGELGRAVHAQWAAALAARAAEEAAQRDRLAATADDLRTAAGRYATTDTLDA
ncbi:hypothetical protein R8Z50_34300 [Longispora sp. K20-0274]|uniref:hypothetical protein n=1 Tax=Longispora sp. K20-0274 TaxID=3088255 RepID=UPI00399BE854